MTLRCWSCGESLQSLTPPLGRQDECPACANYLHVCRMCAFFDPAVTRACREDDAEDVKEKAQLNFCDYFKPSVNAFDPLKAAAAQQATDALAALFDDPDDPSQAPASLPFAADQLFKK
ncbi:MAG: hypothetical protein P8M26_05960 [Gammaproteobacteria bacterium]|nr:hypothetical protein [Gammaproteobacteria bacterium]